MIIRIALFLTVQLLACQAFAQKDSAGKVTFGIEQDILPYATGGYFAGVWAGKGHIRVRTLLARVHKPDFIMKEGFSNNRVMAYAVVGDYFLKKNWNGWWAGGGFVYWKSRIQSSAKVEIAYYDNVLLNGSIGHNLKLYKKFYLSPWAGMHLRLSGDKEVKVDGKVFKPALLNPEASLKVGWFFN